VLQTLQGEQGRTYLADQEGVPGAEVVGVLVAEPELEHVPGAVAAADASPTAAVVAVLAAVVGADPPPGVEHACRVAGDTLLEAQQSFPLARYAGRTDIGDACRLMPLQWW
jgi:hypothetical protein